MSEPVLLYYLTASGSAGVSVDLGVTVINHLGRRMAMTAAWTETDEEPVLTPECMRGLATALEQLEAEEPETAPPPVLQLRLPVIEDDPIERVNLFKKTIRQRTPFPKSKR